MMMSENTPPPTSPSAGARSAPCTKRLDQRKAHEVFDNDMPTTKRQRARYRRGHMQAPGRAAAQRPHAIGAERAARGRGRAAAGARARSAHAIGAERVARGGDGSQRLRRLAHRRAAPSARSVVCRAPSA
jgi:hypothetical protein